jgi:serine/threonine protein kinase
MILLTLRMIRVCSKLLGLNNKMALHVAQKRFKLEEKLGSGAFGEIYAGHELGTDTPVAIKLERVDARYPQLGYEARIYHSLQNNMNGGIPHMHYFGTEGLYNVLVLDRLGKNMETLRDESPLEHLSYKHVSMIADRTLALLERFHDNGFVHRDLKPDNILTGPRGNGFYLIDFGLSKYIRDPVSGGHIPAQRGKHLTGTPRYASIGNHRGYEQGRKDDVESLGYVLLYLLRGSLPWQHITTRYDEILREKQKTLRDGSLCKDTPPAFRRFFRHVATLGFADRPDYTHLRKLFQASVSKQHH